MQPLLVPHLPVLPSDVKSWRSFVLCLCVKRRNEFDCSTEHFPTELSKVLLIFIECTVNEPCRQGDGRMRKRS